MKSASELEHELFGSDPALELTTKDLQVAYRSDSTTLLGGDMSGDGVVEHRNKERAEQENMKAQIWQANERTKVVAQRLKLTENKVRSLELRLVRLEGGNPDGGM